MVDKYSLCNKKALLIAGMLCACCSEMDMQSSLLEHPLPAMMTTCREDMVEASEVIEGFVNKL